MEYNCNYKPDDFRRIAGELIAGEQPLLENIINDYIAEFGEDQQWPFECVEEMTVNELVSFIKNNIKYLNGVIV